MRVLESFISNTDQDPEIGYLTTNMTLTENITDGDVMWLDTTKNDYALFMRNTGTGALLYTVQMQTPA